MTNKTIDEKKEEYWKLIDEYQKKKNDAIKQIEKYDNGITVYYQMIENINAWEK